MEPRLQARLVMSNYVTVYASSALTLGPGRSGNARTKLVVENPERSTIDARVSPPSKYIAIVNSLWTFCWSIVGIPRLELLLRNLVIDDFLYEHKSLDSQFRQPSIDYAIEDKIVDI